MIVDTSVLYAAADQDDRHHATARAALESWPRWIVPEAVVVETDYMIRAGLGVDAELSFLDSLFDGRVAVEPSTREDRMRARDIAHRYRDAEIGYVDAIVVAIAERFGDSTIATLDRRHFRMIKPAHVPAFTLLPEGIAD